MSAQPLPGLLAHLTPVLDHYGYLAVGGFITLEDFGIPVPGETILIAAAVYAGAGRLNIVAVGLVAVIAAVAGDNIGYAVGFFGGRALVLRFGKYVGLPVRGWTRPRVSSTSSLTRWALSCGSVPGRQPATLAGDHITAIYDTVSRYSLYLLIALAVVVAALIIRAAVRRHRRATR
jgi:membrane protein DedA with SNARE-associated domain